MGTSLPRQAWVTVNRARVKTGKTGDNLLRWGLRNSAACACGDQQQTMAHILTECNESTPCTDEDLRVVNDAAILWLEKWSGKI